MAGRMEVYINEGFCFRRRKELTLNLEYNVDCPTTSRDHYDNRHPVPNGETGSA
jgi:hypothetical protein